MALIEQHHLAWSRSGVAEHECVAGGVDAFVLMDRSYGRPVGVVDWLLEADPAIRWQALRDLTHTPDDVVAAERARVATEGWALGCSRCATPYGQWAGGACFPATPPSE